jgi:formamidopyrimidine-DNA glycosylase
MPEGPEVANISIQLNYKINGHILNDIQYIGGRYLNHGLPEFHDEFVDSLPLVVKDVEFKGKLIIFVLENNYGDKWWIFNTLGMSGGWNLEKSKHSHIVMNFCDQGDGDDFQIFFTDQRRFGTIKYCKSYNEYQKKIKSLAGGFLGKHQISLDQFKKAVNKNKKKNFAKALMDQKSICSGVGNYLLSEVCYQTGINPWKTFEDLSEKKIEELYHSISKTIADSFKAGGATIMNYSDIDGKEGDFIFSFQVYGQKEDPDGNEIRKFKGPHGRSIWVSDKYDWIEAENESSLDSD